MRALAAVDLADLVAAERERQLVIVQRHVFCQRDGEVEAKRQIAVSLLETVDLLFCFAAALCQQHVGCFNRRSVERAEAVQTVRFAQDVHNCLHLRLRRGKQLHKPGERVRSDLCHDCVPLCCLQYEIPETMVLFGKSRRREIFRQGKNRRAGILCVFQANVLPPWRKRSGVDRRRMKPSFPNKKILSSLQWDESIADTSWCHPNLKGLPFLFAACSVRRAGDFGEALLIRPLGGCPSRALPQKSFSL